MINRIKTTHMSIFLIFILSGIVSINCSRTMLVGTKWKYIINSAGNDTLLFNRNVEISFVNSNKIQLFDGCNESVFGYSANEKGNIRIDAYHLTKDCENTTTGMKIHSRLMDIFLDAAKYKLNGDTLLIYSRAEKGLDIYTFIKNM